MKLSQTTYTHVSWGPVAAIIGTLVIYAVAQVIAVFAIYGFLLMRGWDETRIESWIADGSVSQFVFSVMMSIVTIGLLYAFLRSRRSHPKELGLVQPKLRDAGLAIIGFLAYMAIYLFLVSFISALIPSLDTTQAQDLGFSTESSDDILLLVFISLVVLPPIVEEIMVRGFLFSGLRTKLSFWYAAVFSSLLFGLAHLSGGEGGSTIWIAVIDTFILGMVLAYLRERTGSLWAPITIHGLKNLTAFSFLFIFKDVL